MLPWLSGGLNPHNTARVGNLFVLDLEDPSPALREACLKAFDALGLGDKDAQFLARLRLVPLWPQHPDPALAERYRAALLAYLDATPVQEERHRWMPHLAQATIQAAGQALEHARNGRFPEAHALLEALAQHDPRFQKAANLPQAQATVERLQQAAADRERQQAEDAYRAAQHALDTVVSTAGPNCGQAQAARETLRDAWQNLPSGLKKKHPKPA